MNPRKILLIQLQNVGDSLVFTPTVKLLRKKFYHSRIDVLVNSRSFEVYKNNPHVDNILIDQGWNYGIKKSNVFCSLKNLFIIWKTGYDIVINDISG